MGPEDYVVSCLNILITIFLLVFLVRFLKEKSKSYGNYMIIILNCAYILFCLMDLFMPLVVSETNFVLRVYDLVENGLFNFISLWSTFFAIYTFTILQDISKAFNHSRIIAIALPSCAVTACILPFLVYYGTLNITRYYSAGSRYYELISYYPSFLQLLTYYFLNELFSVILPAITAWTYYKVYQLLALQESNQDNLFRKTWLFNTTIICLIPNLLCDLLNIVSPKSMNKFPLSWLIYLSKVMLFCWGFLTLYGFQFLQPGRSESGFMDLLSESSDDYHLQRHGSTLSKHSTRKTWLLQRYSLT